MTRPRFTAAQRLKCFEDHGAMVICQCDDPECDTVIHIKGCDIDHALALIDGGKHEQSNFRPIAPGCHAKKSAREHRNNSKCKRVRRKHSEPRKPCKVWPSRPLPSRPFQKRAEA